MHRPAFLFPSVLILACTAFGLGAQSSKPLRVASPDSGVEIVFRLNESKAPIYSVLFQGKPVLADSPLSLEFRQGGLWGAGQKIVTFRNHSHDETYPIVAGKSSQARDHYNQLEIALEESAAPGRRIELQFRAYNDGAAFRYFI